LALAGVEVLVVLLVVKDQILFFLLTQQLVVVTEDITRRAGLEVLAAALATMGLD
jgi:hypothetical protein